MQGLRRGGKTDGYQSEKELLTKVRRQIARSPLAAEKVNSRDLFVCRLRFLWLSISVGVGEGVCVAVYLGTAISSLSAVIS